MANEIFNDDTIYIIDSYGLIYRCYLIFIPSPLTDSNGRNISALFGFFRNLRAMIEHYKPKTLIAPLAQKEKPSATKCIPTTRPRAPKLPKIFTLKFRGLRKLWKRLAFLPCGWKATKPTTSSPP